MQGVVPRAAKNENRLFALLEIDRSPGTQRAWVAIMDVHRMSEGMVLLADEGVIDPSALEK